MKIALFHELNLGGAKRAAIEFGTFLQKDHTVDLYYTDEIEDSLVKGKFSSVYFFRFLAKKWKGGNWKVKLYKDTTELWELYRLHRKIAQEIRYPYNCKEL